MATQPSSAPSDGGRARDIESLPDYVDANRLFGRHGFRGLDWYARTLLDGAPPHGGRALEIGGGSGLLSLWLLWAGMRQVVCLEPEAAGSTRDVAGTAARRCADLGLASDRFALRPDTLQSFDDDGRFDLVIAHDSMNHLDEDACAHLAEDPDARRTYVELFRKVRALLAPGGRFVASDCARINYWDRLRLDCPFAPGIEWHKHQEPETWLDILRGASLRPITSRFFFPTYRLRHLAPLLDWRPVARALSSYFIIRAERPVGRVEAA